MSGELTLCFFFFFLSFFLCFRFSSYLSFLFFFLVFYFVIPLRWLLLWYLHHFLFFSPFCTRQRPPFITPVVARFYCFSPLLPLSGLGVLVDHHQTVCVPLPITKQKGLFCLLVYHSTPSYYCVGSFSLPIPHGMHLVASAQFCPFWWCVIPTEHFPQKSPGKNLKIGFPFSPPLNHTLLPLTHDLTASCIG